MDQEAQFDCDRGFKIHLISLVQLEGLLPRWETFISSLYKAKAFPYKSMVIKMQDLGIAVKKNKTPPHRLTQH